MADDTKPQNPIPLEDQAPSLAARKRIDERVEQFVADVEASGPSSEFRRDDRVTVRSDASFESILEGGQTVNALGQSGRVVGQSFVGAPGSRAAGKVCRGVMLDGGDLITIPEKRLKKAGRASASFTGLFTQEEWDQIFKD